MKKAETLFKQKLHKFLFLRQLQRIATSQVTKIAGRKNILCTKISVFGGLLTAVPATTWVKNFFF